MLEARLGIRQVSGLLALGIAEHSQTVISPPDDENPEQWQKVARWDCAYRIVTVKFLTCRSEQNVVLLAGTPYSTIRLDLNQNHSTLPLDNMPFWE